MLTRRGVAVSGSSPAGRCGTMHSANDGIYHSDERTAHQMSTQAGTIEIREVEGEEFIETGRAVAEYAFGKSPVEPDLDAARKSRPYVAHSRNLVAFVDDVSQATLTSHEMTQNVRGAIVPMGGIGGVASMPSGRRRGVVRQMFERVFEVHREMGMPVSTLYPFRDSFYERMGYASLPSTRFMTVKPETLAPLVRHEKPGTCEQVTISDGFDEWRGFLERYQANHHGFSLRHITGARRLKDDNKWWVAFARHEGEIVGAMTFQITGYGEKLVASTFYATNSIGRYQLLDWVGRHTDQVKEAVIELQPDAYPELWFRDLGATIRTDDEYSWPGPMARVVDVEKLTGIGAGEGAITLDIHDALCPWNNGRFTFRAENGELIVEPGGEDATNITIQGLSALVFTGMDPADFPFRGWGDPSKEAQVALRSLFPPVIPHLHEKF